ncbi:bacillithiol biosynthesis cysteine-adding enzyme BshC [Falsibacillus albus]|uniref:Putative cysteine ligase BshC n=1 Tax=Falsibacillus albus TaxID=2478915 RepID=A0A3L7K0C2_9BACI|nr:bacillithiol biosynthesis cysteine-adding enzyme BshC [Falsibacillus albus]RLQ95839.1 bacillithiol biosynthesis cysteine-adding enzyme BshC [Falsibacillus albus]
MELENVSIPAANRFASQYLQQEEPVVDYFHYKLNKNVYNERLQDLLQREFRRNELSNCIGSYMKKFPGSPQINESLEKLRQPDSSVVIGGQQAGILTGPLYTIHKAISIIKLAKQQEAELGTPVVPVFWIAGEDHDFPEVNHVFVEKEKSLKKMSITSDQLEKTMVTNIEVEKEKLEQWVRKVFEAFGETKYTKDILGLIDGAINKSKTFVEFFSYIIVELFKSYGLLLIDSADPQLRRMEVDHNLRVLHQSSEITNQVIAQQKMMEEMDFPKTLEIGEYAVNLFYCDDNNERILLEFNPEKEFYSGKNSEVTFTKSELQDLIQKNPERISNNVVTRPLIQEFLFPTLAFIAGPGEIAYWAELKKVFEHVNTKMPPIVPRLNITLLDRAIESEINELHLDLQRVLKAGTIKDKELFWDGVKDARMEELMQEAENWLTNQYEMIEKRASQLDATLEALTKKNLSFHLQQISFLKRKTDQTIQSKNDVMLDKYDRIERALRPNGAPQERIWNVFYYINKYGATLIDRLLELDYQFDGLHKVVKL